MKRTGWVALAGLSFVAVVVARADTPIKTVVSPARDNTLYENATGAASNGSGEFVFAGATAVGESRRALLAFDLEASEIPADADVYGVELILNMSMTIAGSVPVSLHRVTQDWGEGASDAPGQEGGGGPSARGDATWIHTFFDGDFWASAGGDFVAAPSATIDVDGEGTYVFQTSGMTDDVLAWLADPSSNFGWVVIGDESTSTTAKRFNSRENSDPTTQPVLVVEWFPTGDPVPATSAVGGVALALLSLLAATAALLRNRKAQVGGL